MENLNIVRASSSDIAQLQKIGRDSFIEAFAELNTEENMRQYLESSFSKEKLGTELATKLSQFYFAVLNGEVVGYLKPAASVWKKPAALDFLCAAAIPIAGAAAVTMLEKMGDINPGTQILVNGANGGLGMFLLQLLNYQGANVTAVANTKALEFAKSWGAGTVIDYTTC